MRPEMSISVVLKEAIKKEGSAVSIKGLSNLLKVIKDRGVNLPGINFKPRPGGYYSEEVETYFGQLVLWDYARTFSPFELTAKGEVFLEESIDRAIKEDPATVSEMTTIISKRQANPS